MAFEVDVTKRISKSNFLNFIGLTTENDETGEVVSKLFVDDKFLNVNETMHGGVHAVILDTVLGQTISQEAECPVSTMSLNVYYSAPAVKNNWLTAKASIVQAGYKIATAEGTITDENGKLIAKAMGQFKILRNK